MVSLTVSSEGHGRVLGKGFPSSLAEGRAKTRTPTSPLEPSGSGGAIGSRAGAGVKAAIGSAKRLKLDDLGRRRVDGVGAFGFFSATRGFAAGRPRWHGIREGFS